MSSDEPYRVVVNGKLTDISDLKVAELKVELKKRGISTAGNKHELFEKLRNVNIYKYYYAYSISGSNLVNNSFYIH